MAAALLRRVSLQASCSRLRPPARCAQQLVMVCSEPAAARRVKSVCDPRQHCGNAGGDNLLSLPRPLSNGWKSCTLAYTCRRGRGVILTTTWLPRRVLHVCVCVQASLMDGTELLGMGVSPPTFSFPLLSFIILAFGTSPSWCIYSSQPAVALWI